MDDAGRSWRVLAKVLSDWTGEEFKSLEEPYRSDRKIVLAAVSKNPDVLAYAAESCKEDRDIVLVAVSKSADSLEHAAPSCQNDRNIVLVAVGKSGAALQFAAPACRIVKFRAS
eukprot:3536160-Amphidinium_carterae.1